MARTKQTARKRNSNSLSDTQRELRGTSPAIQKAALDRLRDNKEKSKDKDKDKEETELKDNDDDEQDKGVAEEAHMAFVASL